MPSSPFSILCFLFFFSLSGFFSRPKRCIGMGVLLVYLLWSFMDGKLGPKINPLDDKLGALYVVLYKAEIGKWSD